MNPKSATASYENLIVVRTIDEVEIYIDRLRNAAKNAHDWIAQQSGDPIEFLRNVKFEKKGFHPISHHRLNLIEQVNQTWTYLVALEATKLLFGWHPESLGFSLAPGASASQALDIMSFAPGIAGAETFAATSPRSNGKLKKDMAKMLIRDEVNRYIFFASPQPQYAVTARHNSLGRDGIAVWSVKV